ncbi:MAG: hypothetical protein WC402_05095 [Candidatus Pacearchaeota archaeon]|jgi:flavodoxin
MKTLVVFYSRTGTTKKVGQKIARLLDGELEEIIDLKNRDGVVGWLSCGKDAMKKSLTKIKYKKTDLSGYDLIIIGGPNWAGNLAPALRTFLEENKSDIKKFAFFCTHGGDNPGNIFLQMQEILRKKPLDTLSLKTSEVKNDLDSIFHNKLKFFLASLKKK